MLMNLLAYLLSYLLIPVIDSHKTKNMQLYLLLTPGFPPLSFRLGEFTDCSLPSTDN